MFCDFFFRRPRTRTKQSYGIDNKFACASLLAGAAYNFEIQLSKLEQSSVVLP